MGLGIGLLIALPARKSRSRKAEPRPGESVRSGESVRPGESDGLKKYL